MLTLLRLSMQRRASAVRLVASSPSGSADSDTGSTQLS